MDIASDHADPLATRWSNYCEEKSAIRTRLKGPSVSEGRRDRLEYRLSDLEDRLIPALCRELQSRL